jgi:membrane associated rhomboid family serine protease
MGRSSAETWLRRTVTALGRQLIGRSAPVTKRLLYAIAGVFLLEGALSAWLGAPLSVAAGMLFVETPLVAWLLSPFLHIGVLHFTANYLLLWVLGVAIEPTMTRDRYVGLVVVGAAVAGLGAYLSLAPFTTEPIAAYGASGVVYALAMYALITPIAATLSGAVPLEAALTDTQEIVQLAALLGVAAALTVVLDIARGPALVAGGVNGAHLGGAAVGMAAGLDML